ncbi:hypothetical protein F183_A22570 [Bryobacterales bacterium F-183]|nr:hypothetical protein F183_A22570 [Bryobacterales bacterium F-183]
MLAQKGLAGYVRFIRSTSNAAIPAKILNAGGPAIKLRVLTPFQDGEPVQVELAPGFHEKGRILYCRRQREGFDVVVELLQHEERRDVRVPAARRGFLCELDKSPTRVIPIDVIDLSRSGVGVLTPVALVIGSLVSVATDGFFVLGEVRHCTPTTNANTYRSGIRTERLTVRDDAPFPPQALEPANRKRWSFAACFDLLKRLLAV